MSNKKNTLFQDMLDVLIENIIPSITNNLRDLGTEYAHITMPVEMSVAFFNNLNIQFPFNENDLFQISEDGQMRYFVIFNINKTGQISIAENFTHINGIAHLRNNIIISEDYVKLFSNIAFENAVLFMISKELTARAQTLEADCKLVYDLLSIMNKIRPKITRNVLVEKK